MEVQGANCGEFIGLIVNGYVSERFGYKKTVLVCLAVMAGLIVIPVRATSVEVLLVYYILAGIPWGIWQTRKSMGFASYTRSFRLPSSSWSKSQSHTLPKYALLLFEAISLHTSTSAGAWAR